MASYRRNDDGIAKAHEMVDAGQYVLDSDWSEAQPSTDDENDKIDRDGYAGFGEWHLGIHTDAGEDTKDRYGFVFGDFQRVHRSGLVAAKQRAGEWGHDDVEAAADELLERLDDESA